MTQLAGIAGSQAPVEVMREKDGQLLHSGLALGLMGLYKVISGDHTLFI